ncbi:MAG: hypothetical protein Kow00107_04870 [Planctomycetota bacterium]
MKIRRTVQGLLALAVCVSLLWIVQDSLLLQKDETNLTAVSPFEGLRPGEFAGTVLLGGFRNIAIDVAWLKALKLQENEEYYKLLAVYRTIANLQPNVTVVWDFNANNMAFNLSAAALTDDDAFRWVHRGIDFLREGVEKNPRTYKLYASIAYIYLFKVAKDPALKRIFLESGENPYVEAERWISLAASQPDATAPIHSQRIHVLVSLWRFDEAREYGIRLLQEFPDWPASGVVFENRFIDHRYNGSVPYMRALRVYKSWKEME